MFRRPAAWRSQRGKALFAAIVAGSVLLVGYLPTTIAPAPRAEPAPTPAAHGGLAVGPYASALAVFTLLEDCATCHVRQGEVLTTRAFPPVPHDTEGWEECSFCHAPRRLAPAPASHRDVPDAFCAACHKASNSPPPSLGHVLWQDQTCSSCHRTTPALSPARDEGGIAIPLPGTHDDRGEVTCALCHAPAAVAPPVAPHRLVDESVCADCHAPQQLGAESPRHAGWDSGLCNTCHTAKPAGPPEVPHSLDSRTDCTFCHRPAPSGRFSGLQ